MKPKIGDRILFIPCSGKRILTPGTIVKEHKIPGWYVVSDSKGNEEPLKLADKAIAGKTFELVKYQTSNEHLSMKLSKSILLPSGTKVPKGTELHFSTEGMGYFKGEVVIEQLIPMVAIEGDKFGVFIVNGNAGASVNAKLYVKQDESKRNMLMVGSFTDKDKAKELADHIESKTEEHVEIKVLKLTEEDIEAIDRLEQSKEIDLTKTDLNLIR